METLRKIVNYLKTMMPLTMKVDSPLPLLKSSILEKLLRSHQWRAKSAHHARATKRSVSLLFQIIHFKLKVYLTGTCQILIFYQKFVLANKNQELERYWFQVSEDSIITQVWPDTLYLDKKKNALLLISTWLLISFTVVSGERNFLVSALGTCWLRSPKTGVFIHEFYNGMQWE